MKQIKQKPDPTNSVKPVIFIEGKYTAGDLKLFRDKHAIWKTADIYIQQLAEYFEITHPDRVLSPDYKTGLNIYVRIHTHGSGETDGNWVYFPWSGNFVHMLGENEYEMLRTNRNRNLISAEEQLKLKNFVVGVAGLSVGNSMAMSMVLTGMANTLKLAERDTLSSTNLNRLRQGVFNIGQPKLELTLSQIYELNPYARLTVYGSGLSRENINDFFARAPQPQLVIDEIDDFEMKVRIRMEAKKFRIPVLMLTCLGDWILADIERYDIDAKTLAFHGLAGKIPEEILEKPITEEDKKRYALLLVGIQNVPERAVGSLKEIHRTLTGRPQLGSSVGAAGGIGAYIVRQIALGNTAVSGRYLLNLDEIYSSGN